MKKNSLNKFEALSREELIGQCLELEDELVKLRPKPAKFKLGQVLAYGNKSPYWPGQPAAYFTVLSIENRMGQWHYGFQKHSTHGLSLFAEDRCRALTATEIDGTQTTGPIQTASAEATVAGSGMTGVGAGGLSAVQASASQNIPWGGPQPSTVEPEDL